MFWNLVRYEFKMLTSGIQPFMLLCQFFPVLIGMQVHYYNYVSFKDSQPVLFILSGSRLWWLDDYTWDFNHFLDY